MFVRDLDEYIFPEAWIILLVPTFWGNHFRLGTDLPRPKAFPPLSVVRMHIATNADTASQTSYQLELVDFPLIPTETWHLASTVG